LQDRHDAKDNIKTVSRMVQSFERTTIRSVASAVSVVTRKRLISRPRVKMD
jgi:hypothetical protein